LLVVENVSSFPYSPAAGRKPCEAAGQGCTIIRIYTHRSITTATALALLLDILLAWSIKLKVKCKTLKSEMKNKRTNLSNSLYTKKVCLCLYIYIQ